MTQELHEATKTVMKLQEIIRHKRLTEKEFRLYSNQLRTAMKSVPKEEKHLVVVKADTELKDIPMSLERWCVVNKTTEEWAEVQE